MKGPKRIQVSFRMDDAWAVPLQPALIPPGRLVKGFGQRPPVQAELTDELVDRIVFSLLNRYPATV
jgi:hypothetical protein